MSFDGLYTPRLPGDPAPLEALEPIVEGGRLARQHTVSVTPVGATPVSVYACAAPEEMCACVTNYRRPRAMIGWAEAKQQCMYTSRNVPYMCGRVHFGADALVLGLPLDALYSQWGISSMAVTSTLAYYGLPDACLLPMSVENGRIVPVDVLATLCTGTQPQQTDAIIELLIYLAKHTPDIEIANYIRYAMFCETVRRNITTVSTRLHALEAMVTNMSESVHELQCALGASQTEVTRLGRHFSVMQNQQVRNSGQLGEMVRAFAERQRAHELMRMANAALLALAGFRNDALSVPSAVPSVLGDVAAGSALGALAAGAAAGCTRASALLAAGGPLEPAGMPARALPRMSAGVQMPLGALRDMWEKAGCAPRIMLDLAAVAGGGIVPTLGNTLPGPLPTSVQKNRRTGYTALKRATGGTLDGACTAARARSAGRPKRPRNESATDEAGGPTRKRPRYAAPAQVAGESPPAAQTVGSKQQ